MVRNHSAVQTHWTQVLHNVDTRSPGLSCASGPPPRKPPPRFCGSTRCCSKTTRETQTTVTAQLPLLGRSTHYLVPARMSGESIDAPLDLRGRFVSSEVCGCITQPSIWGWVQLRLRPSRGGSTHPRLAVSSDISLGFSRLPQCTGEFFFSFVTVSPC